MSERFAERRGRRGGWRGLLLWVALANCAHLPAHEQVPGLAAVDHRDELALRVDFPR